MGDATGNGNGRLRVMTYNVRAGLGATGDWDARRLLSGETVERLAAVIAAEDPDVVALQEVVQVQLDGVPFDLAALLGKRLGMRAAFGAVVAIPEGFWGNAVLSRRPLAAVRTHPLQSRPDDDARAATEVRVAHDDGALAFFSVHLSYRTPETARQAEQLADLVFPARVAGPVIVAGDFNAPPDCWSLAPLRAGLADVFALAGVPADDPRRYTFPDGARRHRALDHIFVSPELAPVECRVVEDRTGASDHNPVVADLVLRPSQG